MKSFRTTLPPHKADIQIQHNKQVMFIGSCFSNNMSVLLKDRKFKVASNPFGILYNPISIFNCVSTLLLSKKYLPKALDQHNGLWFKWSHHSDFSGTDQKEVLDKINGNIQSSSRLLKQANVLFLTLGTAWVYEHKGEVVGNCHKVPQKEFTKRLLTVDEIVAAYKTLLTLFEANNLKTKIVFTVSPVRHLRDGIKENQISKSVLRLAVHKMQSLGAEYFPSYEMVLDDLRDYRFYSTDLLHPNETAVNYIWDYFKSAYFDADTENLNTTIEGVNARLAHRPRQAETPEHQEFLLKLKADILQVGESNQLDYSEELEQIEKRLSI